MKYKIKMIKHSECSCEVLMQHNSLLVLVTTIKNVCMYWLGYAGSSPLTLHLQFSCMADNFDSSSFTLFLSDSTSLTVEWSCVCLGPDKEKFLECCRWECEELAGCCLENIVVPCGSLWRAIICWMKPIHKHHNDCLWLWHYYYY